MILGDIYILPAAPPLPPDCILLTLKTEAQCWMLNIRLNVNEVWFDEETRASDLVQKTITVSRDSIIHEQL